MTKRLCANCKWEIGVVYDSTDGIYRCGACGSEIEDYEEGTE